jgi:uncharacterized protein YoxC
VGAKKHSGITMTNVVQDHHLTTIFGDVISDTISGITPHTWKADEVTGLFHTTTDLATEWRNYYTIMLAGHGDQLNAIQRLEGNAEAVFENTGLSKLSAAQQKIDREDAQRQFDAMAAAMKLSGLDYSKPLDAHSYLTMEHTMQNNAALEELGMQGHGLNNSGIARYAGYTNDFQNNVDNTTLFIGGGIVNNNHKAIADFFDDNVLSHVPFAVVAINGKLTQLNQNAAAEQTLNEAIVSLNDSMYNRTYIAADFSTHKATAATNAITGAEAATAADIAAVKALVAQQTAAAPPGFVRTIFGELVADHMHAGKHDWVADADGLFHTSTDLAKEWHNAYVKMMSGHGDELTATERREANAEAVFQNTALKNLSAADQKRDREDTQRQFDAEAQAAKLAHIDLNDHLLTKAGYLKIEHTLQSNAALEELAMQGHGLNNPPSAKYRGYTNDFQNGVDATTTYVGPGLDHNENALTAFFDDVILGHMPYPTVVINGKVVQLNQNAAREDTISDAVRGLNGSMHKLSLKASNFKA